MSAYHEITQNAVRTFLQNVVVVDNEATYDTYAQPEEVLVEPDPRGGGEVEEEGNANEPTNLLDAKMLTESFASAGLVCSILKPAADDDLTDQLKNAANNADIFVVDWDLVAGDHGAKAKGIIKSIVEMDALRRERLRLISIYTAEPNTSEIRDLVASDLQELVGDLVADDEETDSGVRFVAKNGNMRIVVIRKGASDDGPTGERVGEANLAERLVEEFSLLTHGILPTVGLACISAIRNETYRLLSRFHAGLDASYLLHRCILSQPDEAQSFAAELVGSEIHAIVEAHLNLSDYVGESAIHAKLSDMRDAGHLFKLNVGDIPDGEIDLDQVKEIASRGKVAVKDFDQVSGKAFVKFERAPQKLMKELLHLSDDAGEQANLEFARISSFKRESWGSSLTPKDWLPQLSRGTVVRRNADDSDRYWVCLQPICDCVRIHEKSPFLFAELRISTGDSFDLVARNAKDQDIKLALESSPGRLQQIIFSGSKHHGNVVVAEAENGLNYFRSGDEKYEWIGDLRSAIASRLVHHVTTQLSRVGLDEFEWQRLQATN